MKTIESPENKLHPTTQVPLFDAEETSRLFADAVPVEMEIGCGRGKFLIARAEQNPGIRFIGVDRCSKWMKRGNQKRLHRNLKNLILFKADIREFLFSVPEERVAAFHIYFPDPWPKKRHRKRRLVTGDFLALLRARLTPLGLIEIATDDLDYFSQIISAAEQTQIFWKQRRESRGERIVYPDLKTHYELKFEQAGRPLYYLELQRK